ncbi:MAG: hypothetical protein Q7S26_03290 [bacterium]|nr:hypothetical protein [bacterium]
MILEQKWNILGGALLLLGIWAFVSYGPYHQKCPDEYTTSEEHLAAVEKWTNDFYDKNPDASLGDWAAARHNFYKKNNCKEALQRVEDYDSGKADPASKKIVDEVVDEVIFGHRLYELVSDGKYEEALALSSNAMETYPNSVDIWIHRTMAYYFLSNCAEAAAAAYHVSMIAPEDDEDAQQLLPNILNSDLCAQ